VNTIDPNTASLDGAKPIAHFTRRFPHDEFPSAVFVFVGKDINLPAGYTTATFTAQTLSGQQITSSKQVLNVPFSARVPGRLHFLMDKGSTYPNLARLQATRPAAVQVQNTSRTLPARVEASSSAPVLGQSPAAIRVGMRSAAAARSVRVNYRSQVSSNGTTTPVAMPRSTVSIKSTSSPGPAQASSNIPGKLQHTLNDYLAQASFYGAGAAKNAPASAV
jgi:hypothetical protein